MYSCSKVLHFAFLWSHALVVAPVCLVNVVAPFAVFFSLLDFFEICFKNERYTRCRAHINCSNAVYSFGIVHNYNSCRFLVLNDQLVESVFSFYFLKQPCPVGPHTFYQCRNIKSGPSKSPSNIFCFMKFHPSMKYHLYHVKVSIAFLVERTDCITCWICDFNKLHADKSIVCSIPCQKAIII